MATECSNELINAQDEDEGGHEWRGERAGDGTGINQAKVEPQNHTEGVDQSRGWGGVM